MICRKSENNRKWQKKASRILAVGGMLGALMGCSADSQQRNPTSQLTDAKQLAFETPGQAVDALVAATRADQQDEVLRVLGPDKQQIIYSGDKVADEAGRNSFLVAYDRSHEIRSDRAGNKTLLIGEEEWPLPIPLVHGDNGWSFDTVMGQEEIVNRRISRNEANVREVCRIYLEAQKKFSAQHTHGMHQNEYAQYIRSHAGQHDGLYWATGYGETESPLGLFMANAVDEGYSGKVLSKRVPYQGYYYRILKGQSSHADGGAKDYIVHGHMTRGFALIAFPDHYGDSGAMTFIVNQDGIIYENDFGFDTAEIARVIRNFDPDESWGVVAE